MEQREDTIKLLLKETVSFVEDTANYEEKLKNVLVKILQVK